MTYAMNVCRNNRPHHVMHSIPRGTGGLFGTGLNCIPQQHVSLSALHNTRDGLLKTKVVATDILFAVIIYDTVICYYPLHYYLTHSHSLMHSHMWTHWRKHSLARSFTNLSTDPFTYAQMDTYYIHTHAYRYITSACEDPHQETSQTWQQ